MVSWVNVRSEWPCFLLGGQGQGGRGAAKEISERGLRPEALRADAPNTGPGAQGPRIRRAARFPPCGVAVCCPALGWAPGVELPTAPAPQARGRSPPPAQLGALASSCPSTCSVSRGGPGSL